MPVTITSVTEKFPSGGELTESNPEKHNGGRVVAKRYFHVVTSGVAYDTSIAVTLATGIPTIGTAWGGANKIGALTPRVTGIKSALSKEEASSVLWLVTVEYDNEPPTLSTEEDPDADPDRLPWDEPPEFAYDFVEYERALRVEAGTEIHAAYEGSGDTRTPPRTISNTLGDRFDPAPMTSESRPRLTIVRNVLDTTWTPSKARAYADTCNKSAMTVDGESYDAGCVRLISWTARKLWFRQDVEAGGVVTGWVYTLYYQERIILELGKTSEDFALRLGNVGFRAKNPSNANAIEAIKDNKGDLASDPAALDYDGTQLAASAAVKVLYFQQYAWVEWGIGGL